MMRGKKSYEWLIPLVYIGMILVCVYLNLFSGQAEGPANIAVNAVMFVIVGIVFLNCERHCFAPVNSMTADLERLTAKIRKDAMNSHAFLWEPYKAGKEDLFRDKILNEQFRDYVYELNRIENSRNAYYKCDIEDYINYELTDSVIHRNMLNQVAGAMTGLGILGTFVGLSLGLQSFSTGTTAEITNSIAPLMDGIKVAFHTSIYGMIFSLVFNYVFKRKLDEAERAVTDFLAAYKKYVLPDTATDGINKLMELQQQQTVAINTLAKTVGHQLSEGLAELLEPQFDRFDKTISSFAQVATRDQKEAMSKVASQFIAEMNSSLGNSFGQLGSMIDQTYIVQQENARQMQEILKHTGNGVVNLSEIDRQTGRILKALDGYAADVQTVQNAIERNMVDLNEQKEVLREFRSAVSQLPHSVDKTFKVIDENLVDVENHFNKTIRDIHEATDRVPEVVEQSYAGIEKSFRKTQDSIEQLNEIIERIAHDFYRD